MSNSLLETDGLPPFEKIKTEEIMPAVDQCIKQAKAAIDKALSHDEVTWENLILATDETDDHLGKAFSPVSHLKGVKNTEDLRQAYDQVLPILTQYHTEVGQNTALCDKFKSLKESEKYVTFTQAQQKTIDNALRDFKLSGVDLPADKKQRYAEISQRLSELATQFENNILDATDAFLYLTEDESELVGLPDDTVAAAKQKAQAKGKTGYAFGLDFPTYFSVITYADSPDLRETFYRGFNTKASDQSEARPDLDNAPLIDEILKLRHEMANLVGFANYADYSLATKMVEDSTSVLRFLNELADKTRAHAAKELAALEEFAGCELNAWDMAYYSEKYRLARFEISQETLRPYFPAGRVLDGLFALANRLFGITLKQAQAPVWHQDVLFYDIFNEAGNLIGQIYLDLYARENKRGGAWMDECRVRRTREDGSLQLPVAYLTCNFMGPVGDKPALLTHDDVVTTFHEFGHCLHHLLTRMDVAAVSGINGVPWDAVELPSQFLENFAWSFEVLEGLSEHVDTKAPISKELFDRLYATKTYQAGLGMLRQLEFSLFDFELHHNYDPQNPPNVQAVLDGVRARVCLKQPPAFNRFQNGFSHIFAGGYAAGYFSYKWAEVLSADAFARFEEEGLFNPAVGKAFLDEILSQGGSREPAEMFRAFRGREPSIDALLKHSGLN